MYRVCRAILRRPCMCNSAITVLYKVMLAVTTCVVHVTHDKSVIHVDINRVTNLLWMHYISIMQRLLEYSLDLGTLQFIFTMVASCAAHWQVWLELTSARKSSKSSGLWSCPTRRMNMVYCVGEWSENTDLLPACCSTCFEVFIPHPANNWNAHTCSKFGKVFEQGIFVLISLLPWTIKAALFRAGGSSWELIRPTQGSGGVPRQGVKGTAPLVGWRGGAPRKFWGYLATKSTQKLVLSTWRFEAFVTSTQSILQQNHQWKQKKQKIKHGSITIVAE